MYHAERTIRELAHKRFEDESEIIYVNATFQDDSELGWLLHDFNCTNPEEMHITRSSRTGQISSRAMNMG